MIAILKAILELYLTILNFCLSVFMGILELGVSVLILIFLYLLFKTHK